MCSFKSICFIFIITLYTTTGEISDKRLCIDLECKEPVSYAKTLLRYSSPDPRILSFKPNDDAVIFSKEAGSDTSLWGAEINGKRGYIPKNLVKEFKIKAKPKLLVNTEIAEPKPEVPPTKVEPQKVQEPYEVVDGTTIYLSPETSSTVSPDIDVSSSKEETEPLESISNEGGSFGENVLAKLANWIQEPSLEEGKEDDDDLDDEDVDDDEDDGEESDEDAENSMEDSSLPSIEDQDVKITTFSMQVNNTDNLNKEDVNKADKLATTLDPPPESQDTKITEQENQNTETLPPSQTEKNIESQEEQPTTTEVPIDIVIPANINNDVTTSNPITAEVTDTIGTGLNLSETSTKVLADENIPASSNNDVTTSNPVTAEVAETTKTELNLSETSTEVPGAENIPASSDIDVTTSNPVIAKIDSNETTISSKEIPDESQPSVSPALELNPENTTVETVDNPEYTTIAPASDVPKPVETPEEKPLDSLQINNTSDVTESSLDISDDYPVNKEADSQESSTETPNPTLTEKLEETSTENVKITEETKPTESIPLFPNPNDEVVNLDKSFTVSNEQEETKTEDSKIETDNVEEQHEEETETESTGFFSGLFGGSKISNEPVVEDAQTANIVQEEESIIQLEVDKKPEFDYVPKQIEDQFIESDSRTNDVFDFTFNSDVFLYLVTTAASVILFLFGYMALDKRNREAPLIARINKLEKDLLVTLKENQMLQEKLTNDFSGSYVSDIVPQEAIQELEELRSAKLSLEEQVQALEKELDNSTEVGMELNRLLSEMFSSNGDDTLKLNIEQLQRQLVEQQCTINSINETLNLKETEIHELNLELEISNKKVLNLQNQVDTMVEKLLKIEDERMQQQSSLEAEITLYQKKHKQAIENETVLKNTLQLLQNKLSETERKVELKNKEFNVLKDSMKDLKIMKNNSEALKSFLDATNIKAELLQLQTDNKNYVEELKKETEARNLCEEQAQVAVKEAMLLREKYEAVDKEKVEINTKLDVLTNYFKEKEAQMQKEITKYESMWAVKEGKATSTTERIKHMQEELQNYKAQNETLKEEIISQEVELKSQISMLEKKIHDNWVGARQTERKLQDAQHEAAQLRNRLTLSERSFNEDNNRIISLGEQNGELPLSPQPRDSPASPPLMFGARDLTKSPLLPPFLPPPPGGPFLPPPMPGMPPLPNMPFMPPPPAMFPGDHRPPPLGRMSSPPLNYRFSPDSSIYSPYERDASPLFPYDSDYRNSPVRDYSREDRRDYKRNHPRNGRNRRDSNSSDSEQSNDSMDNTLRKHKV